MRTDQTLTSRMMTLLKVLLEALKLKPGIASESPKEASASQTIGSTNVLQTLTKVRSNSRTVKLLTYFKDYVMTYTFHTCNSFLAYIYVVYVYYFV